MAQPERLMMGVIGCGHWGPNHIRVFSELDRSQVIACADPNRERLDRITRRFPRIRASTDYRRLLVNDAVRAVVIATPSHTHADLCKEALDAGKHVLVEKPLCLTIAEAAELSRRADRADLVLMVGHVFLFNNGIRRLREAIVSGELGRIHYLDAVRTNLGPIRGDVSALFDLGTHDISIFNYLLDSTPVEVSALGRCISQKTIEDVCFATLTYPDGTLAHLHVSWMNPRKVRTVTVVGERMMAHWDDVDPAEPLRFYDKGIAEPPRYNSYGEFQYLLRSADVHLPKVDTVEPLVNQANAFLDAVLDGARCESDGADARAVIAVLEAAVQSMRHDGRSCSVSSVGSIPREHGVDETENVERVFAYPGLRT